MISRISYDVPAMQLRLSPDQIEAKTTLESAVEEVKQELAAESDDQKKDALAAELKEKETKLDTLMVEFEVSTEHSVSCHACMTCLMEWGRIAPFLSYHICQPSSFLCFMDLTTAAPSVAQHLMITAMQKMAVERARSGEIGIRPSERRRQVEEAQMAAGGGAYGAPRPDAYGAHPLHHGLAPSATLCNALCGNASLSIS